MTTTKKVPAKAPEQTMVKVSELTTVQKARLAVSPSLNGATVIQAYQGNVIGKDVELGGLIDQLRDTFTEVKGGDLHTLEAMLISQATALQTIFTSLARRACTQDRLPQYQTFLGLALKAQAQSRATISALVDLKYPKQATFVKQANIANGPQQVNNAGTQVGGTQSGTQPIARARTHAGKSKLEQNKLLEANHEQAGKRMDTRAAQTAERSYQAVETVATVNSAKKPHGWGGGVA